MVILLTNIGTASEGTESGSSLSISVPAGGVPAKSLIGCVVQENGSPSGGSNLGTVSDTAINSYSLPVTVPFATSGNFLGIFYAYNSLALVSGNTIKYTFNKSGNDCAMSAFYATGIKSVSSPLDAAVTASKTNQTSTSGGAMSSALVSGTPTVPGELIVAALGSSIGAASITFTQSAGGWATPPVFSSFHDTTLLFWGAVAGGTLINAGVGTSSFNPTNLGNGAFYGAIVLGFKPLIPPRPQGIIIS